MSANLNHNPAAQPENFEDVFAAILAKVHWNADGLITAIAQDADNKEVLMLAWMNEEALRRTLTRGEGWYYSRSRQKLWHKGEESGHLQSVKAVYLDCDGDAVLLMVEQVGVACHTGARSCFFTQIG